MTGGIFTNLRAAISPIIIFLYIFWFATGIFNIEFNLSWLLIGISSALFPFLSELILKNYSHYEKAIEKINWKNIRTQNKYIFSLWYASAKIAFILLFIFLSHNLIYLYERPSPTTEIITNLIQVVVVIPLLFSIALADGVNIWNIKMKEENTLREKLFSTRLH
jgi:hypothetical protein